MQSILQDIRFGVRTLIRSPGFTIVAVITLALGIGANTTIFSVINSVLLRPLQLHEPDRLVRVYTQFPGLNYPKWPFSPPEFYGLQRDVRAVQRVGAWITGTVAVSGHGADPMVAPVVACTEGFFPTLGVQPLMGRFFTDDEDKPNAPHVMLISHSLWQRALGGRSDILGQAYTIDGEKYEVIGVMPPGFDFPGNNNDVWVPLQWDRSTPNRAASHFLNVVGRLRPGESMQSVQAEMRTLMDKWDNEEPEGGGQHQINNTNHPVVLHPLHAEIVGNARPAMLVLMGAVAFVLLIACVNVTNLLLARAEARAGETAIRAAMGAGTRRLLQQFVTESLILFLIGGGLGLLLAVWGLDLVVLLNPEGIPRANEIKIDSTVLVFTLVLSAVTGVVVGCAPLLTVRASKLYETLKSGGRRTTSDRGGRVFRTGLLVTEIALAVVLLVGSGLMVRSFINVIRVDPGFDAHNVLSFRIELTPPNYPKGADVLRFYDTLRARVAALPGVTSVGMVSGLPPQRPLNANDIWIEGYEGGEGKPASLVDFWQYVDAGTFKALGLELAAYPDTRLIDARDADGAEPTVMVNEAFVRRFYDGQNPVGRKLKPSSTTRPALTVVGVVKDLKQQGLDQPAGTEIFLPIPQTLKSLGSVPRSMFYLVRTAVPPMSIAPMVREQVRQLDPTIPVADVARLEEVVTRSLARTRFLTVLLGAFSVVALLMAAVGIYGVTSYSVARRTNEIGVRMAMGARTSQVLRLVLKRVAVTAVFGLVIGLGGAWLLAHVMSGAVFGVSVYDPMTQAAVVAVLLGVSMLAGFVPARRATRIEPMAALRSE